MRILMLSPHPHVRGPLPKHTPLLVEALRAKGNRVVSEPWGRRTDEEPTLRKIPRLWADVRRVRRELRSEPFDVLVVKTSHEWKSLARDIPLLVTARRSVPSTVVQFHGGRADLLVGAGHRAFKLVSRLLFGLCDGILVLSSEEADVSRRFYPRGRFVVVANPYVRAHQTQGGRRTADGPATLLFASRLIPEKGIFDTLHALALVNDHLECRLVVAGAGPAESKARECGTELGLDGNVRFAGYLAHDELADLYRTVDVFVLPTYWAEGFPTAIAEAMDAGLPVITTRTRGIADHLKDGENALFVPPRDPAALAETLVRLLRDDALRNRMSRANEKKVEEFAPDKVAANYLDALQTIMSAARTIPDTGANDQQFDRCSEGSRDRSAS